MPTSLRSIPLLLLLAACRPPGTKPHDMSVAGHEQAARKHEKAAADFEAECARRPMPAPCWKSRDTWVVKQHRKTAAQHREASAALRAAEDRACVGLAADDRDVSPFTRTQDIASIEPLVEPVRYARPGGARTKIVGVVVTFRTVPGLTAETLQRIVDCHIARNVARGHVVPEMPDCPLVPRGASARVRSVGNGFAVDIRGSDETTINEIRARAERLVRRDHTAGL